MTDPQVWFVTGASSGFGRAIAVASAPYVVDSP